MSEEPVTAARIIVREAGPADADAIAGLSAQLGYPASTGDMEKRIADIAEDDDCIVLVADSNGSVIAWLLVHVCRLVTSDRLAQIAGLVVDESNRGRGVGALLMRKAEEWARGKGCRGVILRSRSTRKDAHAFYRKLGYSDIKTQDVFLKVFRA